MDGQAGPFALLFMIETMIALAMMVNESLKDSGGSTYEI